MSERLLTLKQLAGYLHITVRSIQRGVKAGRLPAPIYVGPKSPRWNSTDLNKALELLRGRSK